MRRVLAVATAVVLVLGLSVLMGGVAFATPDNNPDGGGIDRPTSAESAGAAGTGAGTQGPWYHDMNNGCGQDKKSGEPREAGTARPGWDDNNGWCGKHEEQAVVQGKKNEQNGNGGNGEHPPLGAGAVLGAGAAVATALQVLGVQITRPEDQGAVEAVGGLALPITGANPNLLVLGLLGINSVLAGFALTTRSG